MSSEARDNHLADPTKRWEFDEGVTENFEPMLKASIPGYEDMRRFTEILARDALDVHARDALKGDGINHVLDLGASRGDAVASLVRDRPKCKFTLCEISVPMFEVLKQRYGTHDNVDLTSADLSENAVFMRGFTQRPTLVLSVLSLMFVPIENRQRVLWEVHNCIMRGGTFIIVEKTIGESPTSQEQLVNTYHQFKRDNGYTEDQVERKRMSLKGALVPVKGSWVEELLRDVGFVDIQPYWRSLQFVGWSARKP